MSNPPVADSGLGLRMRPSAEEVSALVASLGEIPDDERQVHFEVPLDPSDAEISAMLDMLAEDSSDAAPAGTLVVAPLLEAGKTLDIHLLLSHLCQHQPYPRFLLNYCVQYHIHRLTQSRLSYSEANLQC